MFTVKIYSVFIDADEDNQQKFWEENYDNSEGDDSNGTSIY